MSWLTRRCICFGICCAAVRVHFMYTRLPGIWSIQRRRCNVLVRLVSIASPVAAAAGSQSASRSPAIGSIATCLPWFKRRSSGCHRKSTRWMEMYSASPLTTRFQPNKDELWLHWALLDSTSRSSGPFCAAGCCPSNFQKRWIRSTYRSSNSPCGFDWSRRYRIIQYMASRFSHHVRALPAVAGSAIRWFGRGTGLGRQYWRFFFAEAFFDFGMFVFFFLYNLYLLQLGFHEDFLGVLAGAMTAGNIAGSLLAVVAMQRFGIRRTLMVSFTVTAALAALRAYVTFPPALIGLAAIAGLVSAAWPVAYSPAVTQLTTEKSRPFGFSLICSAGISIGIVGGLAAGRLPGWIARLHLAPAGIGSYRLALFSGCAFVLLSLVPLRGVDFGAAQPHERKLHRPSPRLMRFLIAMAAWNLGTGALNPFFNVFFAQHIHLPVQQIGYVFAAAQIAQVAAILLSPLVFRKFGLTRGISGMQLATALALVSLAAAGGPIWAAVGYSAYMMSQYMSEPGQFTLLMEAVRAPERNSASALNFLVSYAGQAIAAAGAGWLLAHFGYPPVMVLAAVICVIAAILFRVSAGRSETRRLHQLRDVLPVDLHRIRSVPTRAVRSRRYLRNAAMLR